MSSSSSEHNGEKANPHENALNSQVLIKDNHFQYEPLQHHGWIRLLKFLPGTNLACELVHYQLDTAPPYIALSYTWGDTNETTSLRVNGRKLSIGWNLCKALCALGIRVMRGDLLMWADGICINQNDLKERGEQVMQMKPIYWSAVCVYAYLGDPFEDCEHMLNQMRKWDTALIGEAELPLAQALHNIDTSDPFFFGGEEDDGRRAIVGILTLWSYAWWRRAWVVQEVLVAKRMRLFCGVVEIPWILISPAMLVQTELGQRPGIPRPVRIFSSADLFRLREVMYRRTHKRIGLPFLAALSHMKAFKCTDPRDKIYSALGISVPLEGKQVKPDYTLPIDEVFTQAMVFYFHNSASFSKLDFLGYIYTFPEETIWQKPTPTPNLPSWVPDWSFPHKPIFVPFGKSIDSDGAHRRVYSASGNTAEEASIEGRTLRVKGFVVDTATETMRECNNDESDDTSVEQSWKPQDPNASYIGGGDNATAWLRSLVADVERTWEDVMRRGNSMSWAAYDDSSWVGGKHTSLKAATSCRRMFWSGKGYLGLGPRDTIPGDLVCLFFGGQVLYVIRQNLEGSYKFVGEAYVHGLMDGEAMEAGKFQNDTRTFEFV